ISGGHGIRTTPDEGNRNWPFMTLCLRLSAPAAATASTRLARSSGRSTGTGSSHSPKQVEARTLMVSGRIALDTDRSEEHTSELQSLMRHSYAVFGLKKK